MRNPFKDDENLEHIQLISYVFLNTNENLEHIQLISYVFHMYSTYFICIFKYIWNKFQFSYGPIQGYRRHFVKVQNDWGERAAKHKQAEDRCLLFCYFP